MPLRLFLAAALFFACSARDLLILSPQPAAIDPGPGRYRALVEMYRQGDAVAAVDELSRWDERAVRAAMLAPEAVRAADAGALRAVAVLHLEAVVKGAPHVPHFEASLAAFVEMRRRGGDFDFLRDLYIAAASLMMSKGLSPAGIEEWEQPDADLLLFDGSRQEALATATSIVDEYDSGWHADIGGHFKAADRRYREALSLAPSLLEARLRLGRVLTLTNHLDEARMHLEQVRRERPGGYLGYLADLFLGQLYERLGSPDAASESYEAAIREIPDCQTAYLALGHLREVAGDRERASATVRELFGARDNPQRDPWWMYWYAQYWQVDRRLADLKAMVRR